MLCATSASVVAHDETLMRIAVVPATTCRRTSTCRPAWIAAITRRVRLGVAERHEHLVQHDVVQDLVAGVAQPVGEALRVAAVALDQLGQPARPSERSAAQTSTPRARRDISGVYICGSRVSPGTR